MGSKNWLLPAAAIGAAVLSGGAASPAVASATSGAGGAGAAGALGAGNALSAQGAAGLLGTAGANAAGYGTSGLLAGGMSPIAETATKDIAPLTMQGADGATQTAFQGLDGTQYWGNSITDGTGMTANSFTGGYDSLGGLDRMGQRVQGLFDTSNSNNLGKMRQLMGGNQEQPQQRPMAGGAPRRPMQMEQSPTQTLSPYDTPMTEEEYRRRVGGY